MSSSTRSKKTKASAPVTKAPAKKQKVGIDMSKIPASLRNEGYTSDYEEEKTKNAPVTVQNAVIPDYLKCPVCKELFINPEMFGCGHTVCKMCIDRNICPVCKAMDVRTPMPNYVVSQLIESQYPEKKQQRQQELDEVVELRKRVDQYPFSARYATLSKALSEYIVERRVASYKDVFEHLSTPHMVTELKSEPKESELKYFIAFKLLERSLVSSIGEYIVHVTDLPSLFTWIETHNTATKGKKKKTGCVDYLKMLPMLVICLTRPPVQSLHATYERLAKLYDLDIGKEIIIEEWKNQPSYWIKGVELGEITRLNVYEPFRCSCGMHHNNVVTDDEDEFYDSESDF